MLLLNYSVNFFFYCAFNQKFLDTLRMTFRHGRCCRIYCCLRQKNRSFQNGNCNTPRRSFLTGTSTTSNSSVHGHSKRFRPTRRTITVSDEHEPFEDGLRRDQEIQHSKQRQRSFWTSSSSSKDITSNVGNVAL
jgi:hypothetical protein